MPAVRLLDRRSHDYIALPRDAVVRPAMDAQALALELERALEIATQRIFAGNRAAALNEIGRARFRVEELRATWHDLAGLAESEPACPDGIARPAHGRAA